jgi:F-type H+-transporting ATPase subunit alpha
MRATYNNCYVGLSAVEFSSTLVPWSSNILKCFRNPHEDTKELLMTTDQSGVTVYGEKIVQLLGQVRKTVELGELEETGKVLALGDGIVRISGLRNVMAGELIYVYGYESQLLSGGFVRVSLSALALNLEEDYVGAVLLTQVPEGVYLAEGCEVARSSRLAEVRVGYGLLGRVIDPLGFFLDGGYEVDSLFEEPGACTLDISSPYYRKQVASKDGIGPVRFGGYVPRKRPISPTTTSVWSSRLSLSEEKEILEAQCMSKESSDEFFGRYLLLADTVHHPLCEDHSLLPGELAPDEIIKSPVFDSFDESLGFNDWFFPLACQLGGICGQGQDMWQKRPIESPSPSIISRRGVCKALQTGVLAVDALIPIGRGQRELVIGDRKTGKTSLVLDTIRAQSVLTREGKESVISVYVAIGQKASSVAAVRQDLMDAGLFRSIVFVVANADSPPSSLYIAPFSGTSVGEFFMQSGMDALVVYDDLSKHAAAYREISLLLRRPPGREAYPGDVFFVHARLLERAANLGVGGSLTALPVIETQEGDVSAYIPTNVISITDGQVFLSAKLFNAGVLPAIDIGISVSRVGSEAQVDSVKQLTARLKLVLAQLTELEAFSQFSSDLDKSVVQRLESFRRYRELFKQQGGLVYSVASEVQVLYIARLGGLDVVSLGFGFRRFLSVMRSVRFRCTSPRLVEGAREEQESLLDLCSVGLLSTAHMQSIAWDTKSLRWDEPGFGPDVRLLPGSECLMSEYFGLLTLELAVGLPKYTLSRDHFVRSSYFLVHSQARFAQRRLRAALGGDCEAKVDSSLTGVRDWTLWEEPFALFRANNTWTPDVSGESANLFLDRPFDSLLKSKSAAFGGAYYIFEGDGRGDISTRGDNLLTRDLTVGRYRGLNPRVEVEMRTVYHIMVLFLVRVLKTDKYKVNFVASSWFKIGYCRLVLSKFVF